MDVVEEEEDVNHIINRSPQYMEISEIQSFELKRDDVALKRLLGSGNFCEVYKATMGNDTVAVKSLKGNICLAFSCLFTAELLAREARAERSTMGKKIW